MTPRVRPRGEERPCAKCGALFRPLIESLRRGGGRFCTKQCGYAAVTIHGATAGGGKTAEYRTWRRMNHRCHNPRSNDFANYGGRGIQVCPQWRVSFVAFFSDMGARPSSSHSIDRINNDGNYEPSNCRWATPVEQANNRKRSRKAA